jgi:hypothetical protein
MPRFAHAAATNDSSKIAAGDERSGTELLKPNIPRYRSRDQIPEW